MTRTAMTAFVFALAASPAFAADFNGAKAVCADAIAAQTGRSLDGATTKLLKARDGALLRVTVSVSYPDGAKATGECRIRRGELQSVDIKA